MEKIIYLVLLLAILGVSIGCLFQKNKKCDKTVNYTTKHAMLNSIMTNIPVNPSLPSGTILPCSDSSSLCQLALALTYYNISKTQANSIMNYLLSGDLTTLYNLAKNLPSRITLPDNSATISLGTPSNMDFLLWPCPNGNTLLPYMVSSTQIPVCPF
jgi:hypothetical protein